MTNARFAALHGLSSPCPPLDDARSASQIARSSRAASAEDRKSGALPSGGCRLRSGFGASLIPFRPLRHPLKPPSARPQRFLSFAPDEAKCCQCNRIYSKPLTTCSPQAKHYANYSMHNMVRMPPTLFLVGPGGPLMFMPESLPAIREIARAMLKVEGVGRATQGAFSSLPRVRR